MRGGLLPKFSSTKPKDIKAYFNALQSEYLYNATSSTADFKTRTGFEWSDFPAPWKHFGVDLNSDSVIVDRLSFSFPYFVDVLIDILRMDESYTFTIDPTEMLDDNNIYYNGLIDSSRFAMTYQYADPSKQTFAEPYNGVVGGYEYTQLDVINRPKNTTTIAQEVFDALTRRFEDDWMPFFMDVYQYSLLDLIPYCTDAELERIKVVLKQSS